MWTVIALSIVADIYFELSRSIDEGIDQIGDKLNDLGHQVLEINEQCKTINWKLDAFKTEFDETTNRTTNRGAN